MSVELAKIHVDRLRAGTTGRFTSADIPEWLERNTTLHGNPFSFVGHEYQVKILKDQSREKVIRKCSQVGITELSVRNALAKCALIKGFVVGYTMPTFTMANVLMRTRVDPIISESAYLSSMIHPTLDNADLKAFTNGSFIHMKGSQTGSTALSVKMDMLVHDEVDASDPEILALYQSRLTHSIYKEKIMLSTPTLPGRGIDSMFAHSRRHFNMVKCEHCNEWFAPSYYDHVVIPGCDKPLGEITKANLHRYNYQKAYLACPKCGGAPSLLPEHREWVCENLEDDFVAAGYQISPFDAPTVISPAYLVEASAQYARQVDFVNQNLGLPAEDSESNISAKELYAHLIDVPQGSVGRRVCGIDLGMTCYITVGQIAPDGQLVVIEYLPVPVHQLRDKYREVARTHRLMMTVCDMLPYTETVIALQQEFKNFFGAIYTQGKGLEPFTVKEKDPDFKDGVAGVRQVNVSKNVAMDSLMNSIRANMLWKVKCARDDEWVTMCSAMSRVKRWTPTDELVLDWVKPADGQDHAWHSLLYCWVAAQMVGVARYAGAGMPIVLGTFKMKGRS